MSFAAPDVPMYDLLPTCSNARHPNGAHHKSTPLPASWQWRRRFWYWLNTKRWGCGCDRDAMRPRPVSADLPIVRAPRGPIRYDRTGDPR